MYTLFKFASSRKGEYTANCMNHTIKNSLSANLTWLNSVRYHLQVRKAPVTPCVINPVQRSQSGHATNILKPNRAQILINWVTNYSIDDLLDRVSYFINRCLIFSNSTPMNTILRKYISNYHLQNIGQPVQTSEYQSNPLGWRHGSRSHIFFIPKYIS